MPGYEQSVLLPAVIGVESARDANNGKLTPDRREKIIRELKQQLGLSDARNSDLFLWLGQMRNNRVNELVKELNPGASFRFCVFSR